MNPDFSAARTPAPAVAPGASGETAPISPGDRSASQHARQLQRIADQRDDASMETNSLLAVIGCANADVLEFQALLARQLRQAFRNDDLAIEGFAPFASAFDTFLRLGKQASQFTQLQLRLKKP